jgi:hypothetical protein
MVNFDTVGLIPVNAAKERSAITRTVPRKNP